MGTNIYDRQGARVLIHSHICIYSDIDGTWVCCSRNLILAVSMSVDLLNTCSGHSVKMGQEGFLFAIGMEQEQHTRISFAQ